MYLERLLSILETLSHAGTNSKVTVSEIVEATGFPKPSVYRQVGDLVDAGLLEPCEGGRYALGARTLRLSGMIPTDKTVRDVAAPLLRQAAKDHGASFFLSQLNGSVVEIVQVETPQTGVSFLHPGIGPRPLHACSCAKVIAAFSANNALHEAMQRRLKSYTSHTKTKLGDLELEFRDIRRNGFGECVEELENGVCSVAAPVVLPDGNVFYSLGATGTTRVLTQQVRLKIGKFVVDLCRTLQGHLRHENQSAVKTPS